VQHPPKGCWSQQDRKDDGTRDQVQDQSTNLEPEFRDVTRTRYRDDTEYDAGESQHHGKRPGPPLTEEETDPDCHQERTERPVDPRVSGARIARSGEHEQKTQAANAKGNESDARPGMGLWFMAQA